tara:strand:+ start:34 stop:216 length:183 start_codon:yes stop_codon:yes gene_type:complete
MKIFKQLHEKKIKLDGITYKPYTLGNLPPSFGFIRDDSGFTEKEGIYKWFNYKGLTYLEA